MSIVAMKHLRLIALREDREELLKKLQSLGCVQVSEPPPPEEDDPRQGLTRPDDAAMLRFREREAALDGALAVLKKYAPEKKGLLSPDPQVTQGQLFDDGAYDAALETARELDGAQRKLAALRGEEGKLRDQRSALEPWESLELPLNTPSTRWVDVIFGGVKANAPWETLRAEAEEASGGLAELFRAGKDREQQYLLLLCHKTATEATLQVLKNYGFLSVNLQSWTGDAKTELQRIDRRLEKLAREQEETVEAIAQKGEEAFALRLALDRTRQELRREEARERLLDTDAAYLLEGWFPAGQEGELVKLLESFPAAWEIREPTGEELPQVPVKLKNNRLTRSMNVITEMYSLPAYDGIDPNPLMFPFFVVFFGMMMADMAYGLIMIAASLAVLKLRRPRSPYFMEGVLWCGVSTLIWGALTGGFLGDFIPQLLKLLNPASTFEMPALFTPLNDTIAILLGSLVLGVIQVFTGMVVSVVKKWKDGQFISALFDEITWWIILAGTALTVLGVGIGKLLLLAGFLMLAVGGTREAKGFGKVTSLVGLVYNGVSGFFSDILSYLRLMALMLAGSVIAQVFNTLASVVGGMIPVVGILFFLLISLLGNAINLALNLLGCYVHDLRLQCLEFFNRFYKEGGRPFRPLSIETQYVEILKEEI